MTARFLRHARALPIAIDGDTLVVALPTRWTASSPAAIAAAAGMSVRLEVAVPIELEAALNRLYPERKPPQPPDDAAPSDRTKTIPNG